MTDTITDTRSVEARAEAAGDEAGALHAEIARLDTEILDAIHQRVVIAKLAARARIRSGAPAVAHGGDTEVVDRYRSNLGPRGSNLALILLGLGRADLSTGFRRTRAGAVAPLPTARTTS